MKKRSKIDFRIVVAVLGVLMVVFALIYGGTYLGFDAELTTDIIGILPGLLVVGIGIIILTNQKLGIFAVPGFGVLGLGVAILLAEMNTFGIIIDQFVIDGYSLVGMQGLSVIVCVLIGFVSTRRRKY